VGHSGEAFGVRSVLPGRLSSRHLLVSLATASDWIVVGFLIHTEAIAKHAQSFGGVALVALAKLRRTHSDRPRSSLRNDL